MRTLYVHGMGRSPLSGWPMLRQLCKAGYTTAVFSYMAALEPFDAIVQRLCAHIEQLAKEGPYVVAGHSLGGVLLRAALARLPADVAQPAHVFLIGSPISASRLAVKFKSRLIFKLLAGDCGQMLASPERMAAVPALQLPCTAIVGVAGPTGRLSPFGFEPNDGVVSSSETNARWLGDWVELPHLHTFLPAGTGVAGVIVRQCAENAG